MGQPTHFVHGFRRALHEDLWALARAIAMVDGRGALILVAADRAGDFSQSLSLAANRGVVDHQWSTSVCVMPASAKALGPAPRKARE
jgi:hypothetical protein